MSLTPTGLFMDFSGCTFVYGTTPTTLSIDKIKDVDLAPFDPQVEDWSSDAATEATLLVTRGAKRTITIHTGDIAKALSVPEGVSGTLTILMHDPKNGIAPGGGGLSIELLNATLIKDDGKGQFNKYGMATLTFRGVSADGVTSPLSVTPL